MTNLYYHLSENTSFEPRRCCDHSLQMYELYWKLASYTPQIYIIDIVSYAMIYNDKRLYQVGFWSIMFNPDTMNFRKLLCSEIVIIAKAIKKCFQIVSTWTFCLNKASIKKNVRWHFSGHRFTVLRVISITEWAMSQHLKIIWHPLFLVFREPA